MNEYIERKAFIKAVKDIPIWGSVAVMLADCIPAADVAPVVYGRWVLPHWKNNNYCCYCSKCGGDAMHRDYQWHKNGIYPICPNCGANMYVTNSTSCGK